MKIRKPPFTLAEVQSFNEYQKAGIMHEYTCGKRDDHVENSVLFAKEDGLFCPTCDYRQDNVLEWLMNDEWKKYEDWFTKLKENGFKEE